MAGFTSGGSGGAGAVWQSGAMMFSVLVEVQLRPGVADPQGATIERSLPALGFAGVQDVRVGKAMRFRVEAADAAAAEAEVTEMCTRFLTNPVIEDATITVTAGALA
jgi:phosphoribosylformylglycinamidine synthase subunit PurS